LPASALVTTGIEMLAGGIVQIAVAYLFGEFSSFDLNAISLRSELSWTYLVLTEKVTIFLGLIIRLMYKRTCAK